MNYVRNVVGWILWSSTNTDKISLTLKAGIPFLVLLGIKDTSLLDSLIGSIGQLIVSVATVVSGAITVWGLVRKIWNSFEQFLASALYPSWRDIRQYAGNQSRLFFPSQEEVCRSPLITIANVATSASATFCTSEACVSLALSKARPPCGSSRKLRKSSANFIPTQRTKITSAKEAVCVTEYCGVRLAIACATIA